MTKAAKRYHTIRRALGPVIVKPFLNSTPNRKGTERKKKCRKGKGLVHLKGVHQLPVSILRTQRMAIADPTKKLHSKIFSI